MELTINVPDALVDRIAWYRRVTRQQSEEEAVTELLRYALTFSPRQRLLDILRQSPESLAEISEEEQFALVEQVRQDVFERGTGV